MSGRPAAPAYAIGLMRGGEEVKRYISVAEHSRNTGLSQPTIKNGLETGQIKGIKTVPLS